VLLAERERVRAEAVGDRLRRLRLEAGLSQRQLSEPGVSFPYISRIEAGARNPSVKALRKLAVKLGVSVEYLETGASITVIEGEASDGTLVEDFLDLLRDSLGDRLRVTVERL
jgi:transcriptional regulator with XRE-family HTH domain